MNTRKRGTRSNDGGNCAKHACLGKSLSEMELRLDNIPSNKQTLRRGTKEWPTRKEPASEVDVLWFKDEGGLANALSFRVRLVHKDTGAPSLGFQGMNLRYELMMGKSEVPVDSTKKSQPSLDRIQGCRPVVGVDGTCNLRLRITDVSKNHGNVPFRIKIGMAYGNERGQYCEDIAPIFSEMITVRSKRGSGSKPPKVARPIIVGPPKNPGVVEGIGSQLGCLVDQLAKCPTMSQAQHQQLEQTTAGVLHTTATCFTQLESMHLMLGEMLNTYRAGMQQHLCKLKETVRAVSAAESGHQTDGTTTDDNNSDDEDKKFNRHELANESMASISPANINPKGQSSLTMPTLGRSLSVGSNWSLGDFEAVFSPRLDP
jgi:hypothetical protein